VRKKIPAAKENGPASARPFPLPRGRAAQYQYGATL
jgi:hypothetical protein